jgi:hypothetical protein
MAFLPLVAYAAAHQRAGESISSIEGGEARVVFAVSLRVDIDEARELLVVLSKQEPLAGVPPGALSGVRITISLVPSPSSQTQLDAWSFYDQAVIVFPADKVFTWEDARLRRVMRHELAHVAVGRYIDGREIPVWFREGLAEWIAGGLSCEQSARLQMNLLLQRAEGDAVPDLGTSASSGPSREAYDLFASFFEFLEMRFPGTVASGTLLSRVKEHGVALGFRHAFGRTLDDLEGGWRAYLLEEFLEADLRACDSGRQRP